MAPHIAFVTVTGSGHVNPALAVAEELARRGNQVSYAVTGEYKPRVEAAGVEPILYRSVLPTDSPPDTDPTTRLIRTTSLVAQETIAIVRQLETAYEADRPDVIAYDGPVMAGRVLALAWRTPAVRLLPMFIMPEQYAPEGVRVVDAIRQMVPDIATGLEEFLTERDLSDITVDQFFNNVEQCCVSFLPREFQIGGNGFDDRFTFAGPCLSNDRLNEHDWAPRHPERPVLLVSLGTVFNRNANFFSMCLNAFGGLPWHTVIATGGWVEPTTLGPVPDHVEIHQHVPQLAVLQHAAVFLCHGGMGSVMEALYRSTPIVVVPQSSEHELTGQRVEELGLGRFIPRTEATVEALRAAVLDVSADHSINARVREMSKHIRAAGGRVAAADSIEKFVGHHLCPEWS
ncbi:MAG: oleandomycin glycosyltransferase [Actinobacteria bacterium]|nr:oleandomycin glycosyltransferase [Acidobacteriota bacterium]MCA1701727.1 oleandomycin glycosyltransferase [Actinomycetota bacterium]